MRFVVAAAAALVLVSLPQAPAVATCAPPVDVPGVGLACPVSGGWRVTLPDGSAYLTHGADVFPPGSLPGAPGAPALVACAAPGEAHAFRVLYVVPPATLDMEAVRVPLVREGIALATGKVLESSLPLGADVRPRFFCDAEGAVEVTKVFTRGGVFTASWSNIVAELKEQGFDAPGEKYWVVYEGPVRCGQCLGVANVVDDRRPGADNAFNDGGFYALTFIANFGLEASAATLSKVMLHEAAHTMGAVLLSAPHSTGGWHCTDGRDIMCYPDGGPEDYDEFVCPRLPATERGPEMPFDCGNDDYFHPFPREGSHLATQWNVGASHNRFMAWRALG